jgi:hypothetical protein
MGSQVTTNAYLEIELQRIYNHIENSLRNADTLKKD